MKILDLKSNVLSSPFFQKTSALKWISGGMKSWMTLIEPLQYGCVFCLKLSAHLSISFLGAAQQLRKITPQISEGILCQASGRLLNA